MTPSELVTRIDVAVAVVFDAKGRVLWGCRPEGKPYAGYWEFPGGKVEAGESIWQALVRELHEELGITALEGGPWFIIEHDYEHAHVRLHLYRVWRFAGEPKSLERQAFKWGALDSRDLHPILPATEPLLPLLDQPNLMVVTQYSAGFEFYSKQLVRVLQEKATRKLVLFREKDLTPACLIQAYEHCQQLCDFFGVRLVINSHTYVQLCELAQTDSRCAFQDSHLHQVHLTEQHLFSPLSRYQAKAVGASVHNSEALQRAYVLGLQYVLLGAVKHTETHPDRKALGWSDFERIAALARLPVYAIGGLTLADLQPAMCHGAHGIAMIRGFLNSV